MASTLATDYLQAYPFWLLDVAPVDPLGIPVLTPLFGFSGITMPEIQLETTEITEGNWYFKRKVIKGGSCTSMTLKRGSRFFDADFYRWIRLAQTGDPVGLQIGPVTISASGRTPRRSLLLVHFFARFPGLPNPLDTDKDPGVANTLVAAGVAAGLQALGSALSGQFADTPGAALGQVGVTGGLAALGAGVFNVKARIPAKAWLMHGCIPIKYKAATDFDATSSAISIQELEVAVEMMEEVSLAA